MHVNVEKGKGQYWKVEKVDIFKCKDQGSKCKDEKLKDQGAIIPN